MQYIVLKAKIKRHLPLLVSGAALLAGLVVGIFLVGNIQIFQKQAAGICPAEGGVCSWEYNLSDQSGSQPSFHYEITDLSQSKVVKSGTTSKTKVTFTPQIKHQYSCKVWVENSCGAGPSRVAINTCQGQPPTPTFTTTPSVTSTPTPEQASPTPLPSATAPAPTTTLTPTPTPTPTPVPSSTLSVTPNPSPTLTLSPTSTPLAQKLPESGTEKLTLTVLSLGLALTLWGLRLLW